MRILPATSLGLVLLLPTVAAQDSLDPGRAHRAAAQALEARPNLPFNPTAILVRFSPSADESLRAHARGRVGRGLLKRFDLVPGLELVDVATSVDQALAAIRPFAVYAEPDYVVRAVSTPNDTYFGLQWALHNTGQSIGGDFGSNDADIDGVEAWNVSTGDPNYVVAIIDTGTQYTHPDLAANMWTNPGEIAGNGIDDDLNGYVDDVRGWDFFDHDNDPDDPSGHGTHTAGTVGAVGDNGIGVAGVNWRCKLMPLRFLGPSGGYTSDAVLAVQYAAQKGVRVSNNSWGGGGFSQSLYDAIDAAKSAGHLFCAAAGNYGANNDASPFYPASYALDNVISVAATDNDDARASFSNYGVASVDLGAPGVSIASTYPGGGYVYMSGTSMATPHVAGVAALVGAQNPGWTYLQVRNRLLSTVRPTASMTGVTASGGILNAAAALGSGPVNQPPQVAISQPSNGASVLAGASVTFSGSANDPEQGNLGAALVWTSSLQGTIGTGTSFSRSDLAVGVHLITASATDAGLLTGSAQITLTVTSAGVPPAAPGSVTATDLNGGNARISWVDGSSNETGFEIQRETRVGNQWRNTATVGTTGANATTFVDHPGSGRFRYRVRSFNAVGSSPWTGWATAHIR